MADYQNPENVAVEKLKLTVKNDGVIKNLPALEAYWVDRRTLTLYYPPPKDVQAKADLQTWKESTECYIDDLSWLLCLDYHKFWSTVIYHPKSMDMLVSFLQEASPPYIRVHHDESVNNLYNTAYKKIFTIFSRLITNREAQDKWMDKDYLSALIYDKYIFTIPIMFDLCLLYGSNNKAHMSKLISFVFKLQPKYQDDLTITIEFLKQVLAFVTARFDSSVQLSFDFKGFSNNFGGLQHQTSNTKTSLTIESINDLVLHVLDSVVTIKLFLDLYQPARAIFRDREFYSCLVNFYENTIPKIYEKIHELDDRDDSESIYNRLDLMRSEILDIYHMMLNTTIDEILMSRGKIEDNVNKYLTIVTDGISEKEFIVDYNTTYSVEDDLDIICGAYSNMDPVKRDFILQAIYSHYDDPPVLKSKPEPYIPCEIEDRYENTAAEEIPEETKTQRLISEVKDIFPDLGEGYIMKCLEHYDFNTEIVINSLLEGNLDESLQKLDPLLPLIPVDKLEERFLQTGVERLNVFDNDEFDVMTRDHIDQSRVHRGKKKFEHKNLSDMLNDKTYVHDMKNVYSKYTVLSDDDEYDDTYDDLEHAHVAEVTADDKRARLNAKESEEDSEDDEAPNEAPKDQFCENPEVIRARYQARREQKHGPRPEKDVVGRARGQGQEKDVLLNRKRKDAQKSTRANHNRRSGAQWKRSSGIVPS